MRTWVLVIILFAALGLCGLAYSTFSSTVNVEAARVERHVIREYVEEEGKTRLAESYEISMPYNGRISPIDLHEGTPVKKGEVVARLVPLDLQLNVDIAKAAIARLEASIRENDDASVELTSLEQAINFVQSMNRTVEAATARVKSGEAKLGYAEKNLARVRKLFETKTKSQDEFDQAQVTQVESSVDYQQDVLIQRAMESMQAATALMPTAVRQYIKRKTLSRDVLEKQLAEAQINLQQVEKDQQRGTLVSPIDGIVLARLVSNEGQLAAGTTLLRIGRWEDLEVEADVLSQEVVQVKPGDPAEVFGPAIGLTAAHAIVNRIHPAGFTKISSLGVEQQRVKVILRFEPEDLRRLRAERELGVEYRVRCRVFTAENNNALVIPRSALFRDGAGDWWVFVIRSGRATLQAVTVGLSNDDEAEILTGLATEDTVILAPETTLNEGQAVRPVLSQKPRPGA